MADRADTWYAATARRDRLLNVLEYECVVSGLLRTTAQDVSFAAIRSCLRARLLQAQLGNVPKSARGIRRPDASVLALGDQADQTPSDRRVESLVAPSASGVIPPSSDSLENRIQSRHRNTIRAQLFAAEAHNRAARTHERAASLGLGDAGAHRQAADRHRAAQAEAILRRLTYLLAAEHEAVSDGGAQTPPTDDAA
ncbi:hypothetical protein [Mycobacterium colombiense]|uniref:hypothetical protein n=1 Tax=Mycobacterium colombiense TaxID=339268 RepID=UPI0012DB69CF|nr:hypothetical protein [Mycobacterium colombiense]